MKPERFGDRVLNCDRSQANALLSHWSVGPYKVRIMARIDASYLYQSSNLKSEVWKPNLGWVEVATLHYSELEDMDKGEARLLRVEHRLMERTLWILESE